MSDEKEPKDPMEELRKNLQDMLKQGGPFIPFGGGGAGSGAASGSGEAASGDEPDEEDRRREAVLQRIRQFSLKPKEIRDYLDRFVIQQREAKKVISVAICDHYNHARLCLENPAAQESDYAKQNVVLLGPTGVGKTYLMRNVAKLIGVPFVKADATKFSETGYVGGDVEDLVRDLVKAADGDVELAQYGIIYIDEVDKVASRAENGGRDVSGRGVQINLLKLMEESEVNLQSQTDLLGQMQAMMDFQRTGKPRPKTINTRHILFIVSGAFDKLEDIVAKRLNASKMGFGAPPAAEPEEQAEIYLDQVESRDFIEYGFEPEFVGRLPVRVACRPLKPDDLLEILLSSEGSILKQYKADFEGYGIELEIDSATLRRIAEEAYRQQTGARGLMTVLERLFRNFKFELPSTGIKRLRIDEGAIDRPDETLKDLLRDNADDQREALREQARRFAERFEQERGFKLQFDNGAIDALVEESVEKDVTIRALCERKFRDFHHGLTLISRNTGQTAFPITRQVVENAERELSDWVVKSYRPEGSGDGPASGGSGEP